MIKSSINIYIVESDEALMQALKENIECFFIKFFAPSLLR